MSKYNRERKMIWKLGCHPKQMQNLTLKQVKERLENAKKKGKTYS